MRHAIFGLLSLLAAFLIVPNCAFGQVPTLDPAQTVNLATGSMQFSLPLATVRGVNGHDFNVGLNYQAGIQYNQQSSSVGLGFSCGAGAISRKVVFMPDDNGANSYTETSRAGCIMQEWVYDLELLLSLLNDVKKVAPWIPVVGTWITYLASVTQLIGQACLPSASDYRAGGTHVPSYDYATGQGRGFFNGGEGTDLPDVYLVNTPYISGELIWLGSPSEAQGGHFVFRQTSGTVAKDVATTKVIYNHTDGRNDFELVLADGTHLYFAETRPEKWATYYYSYLDSKVQSGTVVCWGLVQAKQSSPVIMQWFLTRVEFNDYVPGNPAKGSWIAFDYYKDDHLDVYQLPDEYQISPSMVARSGGTFEGTYDQNAPNYGLTATELCDVNLKSITTPVEKADFNYGYDPNNYKMGRLDDLWFKITDLTWAPWNPYLDCNGYWGECAANCDNGKARPICRRLLKSITVKPNSNALGPVRTAQFAQDYSLAPHSLHSETKTNTTFGLGVAPFAQLDGNSDAGRLTLKSVSISDGQGRIIGRPVEFQYRDDCNPYGGSINNPGNCAAGHVCNDDRQVEIGEPCLAICGDLVDYLVWQEQKDYWGYYKPNSTLKATVEHYYVNDFNKDGIYAGAETQDQSGKPLAYAAAWSLAGVHLPLGMSIEWDYEANRYDKANGEDVTSDNAATGVKPPKYGAGIRVREMRINDGEGTGPTHTLRRNFFYTDVPGEFRENPQGATSSNISGHATVEPFPFLDATSSDDDPRPEKARGGLYSPAQVLYEMVQVVDNYQPPATAGQNGTAPIGYTVHEFTTSKDFPNTGTYGQYDEGWRRGLPWRVTLKAANGNVVKQTTSTYTYQTRITPLLAVKRSQELINTGYVRLTQSDDVVSGVTTTKSLHYAEVPLAPDRISENAFDKHVSIFNNIANGEGLYGIPYSNFSGMSIATTALGNPLHLLLVGAGTYYFDNGTSVATYVDFYFKFYQVDWNHAGGPTVISPAYTGRCVWEGCGPGRQVVTITGIDIVPNGNNTADIYVAYDDATPGHYYDLLGVQEMANGTLNSTGVAYGAPTVGTCTPGTAVDLSTTTAILFHEGEIVGDRDGQPNQIIETNSEGSVRTTEPMPAYWWCDASSVYSTMLAKNMLTQLYGTRIWGKSAAQGAVAKVIKASATTWDVFPAGNCLPRATYLWNVPMTGSGEPSADAKYVYQNFDPTPAAINPNWQLTGTVVRYDDNYSAPVETSKPLQANSVAIYRHDTGLPVASITGARFGECGVFTCDYQDGVDPAYFDEFNGWEKGGAVLSEVGDVIQESPFGQMVVRVNSTNGPFGPTKNIWAIDPNSNYTFSAWVYPVSSPVNPMRFTVEPHKGAASSPSPANANFDGFITGLTAGKWNPVSCTIASAQLKTWGLSYNDADYLRIWIGNYPGDSPKADFFVQDIRFYPSKAMVSTVYYDPKLSVPITTVDANNKARRTVFDGFGRPVEVYNTSGQKVKDYQYHVIDRCASPPYSKDFEGGPNDFIDFSAAGCEGSCNATFAIVGDGFGSGHCLQTSNTDASKTLGSKLALGAVFGEKRCVFSGYYKSDYALTIGATALSTVSPYAAFLNSAPLAPSRTWAYFEVPFDSRNTPLGFITGIAVQFDAGTPKAASFLLDHISVCIME